MDADELEKACNSAKGRLVLSLEDPKGRSPSACGTRCSRAGPQPEEVLAALDRVTVEDLHRVAQDIVREERCNLAVVGPFDDPDRFEPLLDLTAA